MAIAPTCSACSSRGSPTDCHERRSGSAGALPAAKGKRLGLELVDRENEVLGLAPGHADPHPAPRVVAFELSVEPYARVGCLDVAANVPVGHVSGFVARRASGTALVARVVEWTWFVPVVTSGWCPPDNPRDIGDGTWGRDTERRRHAAYFCDHEPVAVEEQGRQVSSVGEMSAEPPGGPRDGDRDAHRDADARWLHAGRGQAANPSTNIYPEGAGSATPHAGLGRRVLSSRPPWLRFAAGGRLPRLSPKGEPGRALG
jgi:hypothetical protein